MKQLALDIGLAPLPSLDNFASHGNEAALDHLHLWVHNPLRSPVPTLLWGPPGCGKTHLLQAVRLALLGQGTAVGWLECSWVFGVNVNTLRVVVRINHEFSVLYDYAFAGKSYNAFDDVFVDFTRFPFGIFEHDNLPAVGDIVGATDASPGNW